ncbi:MAG: TIGR03943 family protein [Phycisphaerae bacterium]|nr:TIGR03943 family protein [Phycisphaerae bacterium]
MAHNETSRRLTWLVLGILWGAYLVVMYRTGALQRCYQTSPYFYFTGAAGVLLVLLSAKAALAILRRPASACTCEACHGAHEAPAVVHWSWWADAKAHLVLGLVLMPLMVGVLVPSRGLNALAALRRGGASDPQDILDTFRAERRKFVEMEGQYKKLTLLEVLDHVYAHGDTPVSTLGFVTAVDRTRGDLFQVTRFKMTCCAADAVPISLHVRWADASRLQRDTWVRVHGTARRETLDGRRTVVITAEGPVQEIAAPASPYM